MIWYRIEYDFYQVLKNHVSLYYPLEHKHYYLLNALPPKLVIQSNLLKDS